MLVKEQFRLPMLNAVAVPSGMNEVRVRLATRKTECQVWHF